jgi:hypothetical protein
MSYGDSGVRNQAENDVGDFVDIMDAIVNKKDLSSSPQLKTYCIPDMTFIKRMNFGRNWLPVRRGSSDDT